MTRVSIASFPKINPLIAIALAALLLVSYYLLVSASLLSVGFPLDDAWIHLTYARNFAEHGEWAFRLGERSAGSTAPLWTFLLSLGYVLQLAPYLWTFFLGWLTLTLLGISAEIAARKFLPAYRSRIPEVGLFFVAAWHLTWSAVSGMETLLHGTLIFIALAALSAGSRRYLMLGALAGLSVWTRPDGVTLLGPLLLTVLLTAKSWRARGVGILKVGLGFGALFLFYLLFNLALSGHPLPNTFYAKQAEYGSFWMSKTLEERIGDYLAPVFASPFLILAPGTLLWLKKAIAARNWGALTGLIWCIGYIAIYFTRLPAYQHGRYIIPALPILYFWGAMGFIEFTHRAGANKRIVFLWRSLLIVACAAFTFIGARQNAREVYWIENEMVATAKWAAQNLPKEATFAVHDIGAMGYFTDNPLLDLAGLINPEVIPFIRDEARLATYLDAHSVDYLIALPSFYPNLISGREAVFKSGDGNDSPFGERMVIYRWR